MLKSAKIFTTPHLHVALRNNYTHKQKKTCEQEFDAHNGSCVRDVPRARWHNQQHENNEGPTNKMRRLCLLIKKNLRNGTRLKNFQSI